MTLNELYKLKLNEYKNTGFRERPSNLLAMLLLPEIDKYEIPSITEKEFYKLHKEDIDKKINQVEKDFNFTKDYFINCIKEVTTYDNYEEQKVWIVFELGIYALYWGLVFSNDKTPEKMYEKYFDNDDTKKIYNIEDKAIANNIEITLIDELINKIVDNPDLFYRRISEELTIEERLFIIKNLENKSCTTCKNGSCRTYSYEKVGNDEDGKPQGYNCLGWSNDKLIGKCKVRKISDINKLVYEN